MKRILGQFVFLFIFISVFFAPLRAAESVLHPGDLRCEYLKNPLGIDRTSSSAQLAIAGQSPCRARPETDGVPNSSGLVGASAGRRPAGPVGFRPSRFRPEPPRRLRRQAAGIAPVVLVEGPDLGPERRGFSLERAGTLEHGIASPWRLAGAVDWLERRR